MESSIVSHELAAELVSLKVDLIVAGGGSGLTRAAKKTTKTIPIVITGGSDPVGAGLVASLARPGGNVTGLTDYYLRVKRANGWNCSRRPFPRLPALACS